MALNPVIKFTTLFGLLAVELAVALNNPGQHSGNIEHSTSTATFVIAALFLAISMAFVWRKLLRDADPDRGLTRATDCPCVGAVGVCATDCSRC